MPRPLMNIRDLKPLESDASNAYERLLQEHEPRSVWISITGTRACMNCDEVWPCDTAIVLAHYREFRLHAEHLREATENLIIIAEAAAEVLKLTDMRAIDGDKRAALLVRLFRALEHVEGMK